MIKAYRDSFGNLLPKQDVEAAVRFMIKQGRASPILLQREFHWGFSKSLKLATLFQDAGVISRLSPDKPRTILISNEEEAVNAALRQLKKGAK